jgi:diaminopimelate decarboxylase
LLKNSFGHNASTLLFWHHIVRRALREGAETPFYLFSALPIQKALRQFRQAFARLPLRPWLSLKTQPLPALLTWWKMQGLGIEAVSEFELLAALREGFAPENILINGPAKHHWLPRHSLERLKVNFDSANEIKVLAPMAKRLKWSCGVRLQTTQEFDPEAREFPTQFGFVPKEVGPALGKLRGAGIQVETVHFHLRTNVATASIYEVALDECAEVCRANQMRPKNIDCGGGFPPAHILSCEGKRLDSQFSLSDVAEVYKRALPKFPAARQIWVENGRWLSARSGVLVLKVLDAKQRPRMRHLICDGGRTLNALPSAWEEHAVSTLPARTGRSVPTTVTGPTCMAFDQIVRRELPKAIRPGDHLIWFDAGAYHLPWETRFSHARGAVWWHDGKKLKAVREKEGFADWWAAWSKPARRAESNS